MRYKKKVIDELYAVETKLNSLKKDINRGADLSRGILLSYIDAQLLERINLITILIEKEVDDVLVATSPNIGV